MNIKHSTAGIAAALMLAMTSLSAADTVSLKVTKDGSLYRMVEMKITGQDLAIIAATESKKGQEASIRIVAEPGAPLEAMTTVMDTCRKAGISHFVLSEEAEKKESKTANQAAGPATTAVTAPGEQEPRHP